MKKLFAIISLLAFFPGGLISQSIGEMSLQGDKLIGHCEDQYFSGFSMELDTTYLAIDSIKLFSQFPRIGNINFKNSVQIPTEFTVTTRAGYSQVMFRFKAEWYTFDHLTFSNKSIKFTIDRDPDVPCTKEDLQIIKLAKNILSEEKYWNNNDDRNCEDDLMNKRYSLYCALRTASIEIQNKYNHRNAVLQKLRHVIVELYPNKEWKHRLMDFNNMEETSYEDIIGMLAELELRINQELKERNIIEN